MQQSNSIGTSADSVNHRVKSPRHPLLSTFPIHHPCGYADALRNCADVLATVADLFGGNMDTYGYDILESNQARHGVYTLLFGVIDVLNAAAKIETSRDAYEEITIICSQQEYQCLQKAAEHYGRTVDDFAETLIREGAERANKTGPKLIKPANAN